MGQELWQKCSPRLSHFSYEKHARESPSSFDNGQRSITGLASLLFSSSCDAIRIFCSAANSKSCKSVVHSTVCSLLLVFSSFGQIAALSIIIFSRLVLPFSCSLVFSVVRFQPAKRGIFGQVCCIILHISSQTASPFSAFRIHCIYIYYFYVFFFGMAR